MIEIDNAGGGIILLVGSAGDGKSHLLSKIQSIEDKGWGADAFYNDATASCSPNKTAIDTLKEGLIDFSDKYISSTSKKKILAINLGKLNQFIDNNDIRDQYGEIARVASPLFDDDDSTHPKNSERVKVVEFSNKQIFEIQFDEKNESLVESKFLSTILDKLVCLEGGKSNPFYEAYQKDLANKAYGKNPILLNYQILAIPEVRRCIVLTVIEAIIRFKLIITPREFLDFIYSILVPKEIDKYKEKDNFYDCLLPTLFYGGGANPILEAVSKLDPLKYSCTTHDNALSLLFTSNAIPEGYLPLLSSGATIPQPLVERVNSFYANNGRDVENTTKFLFRLQHLLSYHSESKIYTSFIEILRGIFKEDSNYILEVFNLVTEAIPRYSGSYYQKQDLVPLNIQGGKYRLFAKLEILPLRTQSSFNKEKPWEFYPRFKLIWDVPSVNKEVSMVMDFSLYSYLYDLREGKLAISYENEKNMEFGHFIGELAKLSDCSRNLTVVKVGANDMTLKESLGTIQLQ